ncbi:MAG: sigma-70 family RNA polymerase sigma factor [Chitinophagaceae bacterium]|nr:sigma-70 family RNA polymerase sigma factor [Chitinophagaceae bacterium]
MSFLKNIPSHSAGDADLVAAYRKSGDLTLLATLYQPYMDLLYGVALKYLGEPETAKDAVMAIFEELAQKLLKHEVENFKGWLYTLAKNHCLMQLRSTRRMRTGEFDPDHMQIGEEVHLNGVFEKEQQLDQLSKCLETLSSEQKTVVELFYLQHKCYKDIGTMTGLEWNKVRSHIQNGRRNLKICMEQQTFSATPIVRSK